MANVILVAYLLIVLALIGVILVQRSEGGGLGIGGGTAGGMMTARGSANLLTRTTAILAALFMATAIGLTILNEVDRSASSVLDKAVQGTNGTAGQPQSVLDALNQMQNNQSGAAPAQPAQPTNGTGTPAPANAGSSTSQDGLSLPVPNSTGAGQGSAAPAGSAPASGN